MTEGDSPPNADSSSGDSPLLQMAMIGAAVVVAVLGAIVGARWLADRVSGLSGDQEASGIPPGQAVTMEIIQGWSAPQIAQALAEVGVVSSSAAFESAVEDADAANDLQAGSYELVTGMSARAVVAALVAGPVIETFWLTLPEGLRVEEILDRLADQTPHTRGDLVEALLSGTVRTSLRLSQAGDELQAWEGLLFPDTYQFAVAASAADILQRLADTAERRFEAIDWSHPRAASLSPHERVTVASIIEAETRVDRDRALVATVIYNRLDQGLALQIDATVLYALGVRGRPLTAEDLEVDSPYNTYRVAGLPPGPIGAPGADSLRAASAPAEGDYLYYVLTGEDGSHSFTDDFDEFRRWAEEAREKGLF